MRLDDIPENGTINIAYEAGLGDVAMSYSSLDSPTSVVLSLHDARPDIRVRAVLNTVSDSLPDLFAHNPYFDDVSYHTWNTDIHKIRREQSAGFPFINDCYGEFGLTKKRMPFFLDPHEREQFQAISAEPYIGIHFHAGAGERNWLARICQKGSQRVVDVVLAAGFNAVILGGSSRRTEDGRMCRLEEQVSVSDDPRVFNLVGKASVRLQAQLASCAAGMVGTMSCWLSLGTQFNRRAWVALPPSLRHWFEDKNGGVFRELALQGASLNWWDGRSFENELSSLRIWLSEIHQTKGPVMGLVKRSGIWVREEYLKYDMMVVDDVINNDAYRVNGCTVEHFDTLIDVGAHIGTFAVHWHKKNPNTKIICIEACAENIETLKANVGDFAQVVHAACTYQKGEIALLNSVHSDGNGTGGSTVVPLADLDKPPLQPVYRYLKDARPLPKITLEEAMAMLGTDTVAMLKLDCEYSELDILGNTPYPDRIRFIVAEYHSKPMWDMLRERRFLGWPYGELEVGSCGMDNIHLANPVWPPLPKTGIRETLLANRMPGDEECIDRGFLYYDYLYRKFKEIGTNLKVCEIGVRSGYSSLAMFLAGVREITGYDSDTDGDKYTRHAEKILSRYLFRLIHCDTKDLNELVPCDVVVVDGDHRYDGCLSDLQLAAKSNCKHILVDDYDRNNPVGQAVHKFLDANGKDWGTVSIASVGANRGVVHLKREKTLKIAVPTGIGDTFWALTKVPDILKKSGIGKVMVHVSNSMHNRAKEFIEAFDFVERVDYMPFDISDKSRPVSRPDGICNYYPTQKGWNGYDWLLQANQHLEEGKRLEDWLPEFEIDWEIAKRFQFKPEHLQAAEKFHEAIGQDVALFFAASTSGNTTGGHNRNEIWKPTDWALLARESLARGITPVFVGAGWDLDYWEKHLKPVMPQGVLSTINQWPIGVTFAFAKRCRFTVCYQSGIGIFSVFLGIPTAMWWRAKGDSVSDGCYISFDEKMAHCWAPPGAVDIGRYLPLIYGRESAAEVWEWISTMWLGKGGNALAETPVGS